jgi:hypothetical protein
VGRSTLSIFSVFNNEQANFLAAESTLEVSRLTHLLTLVSSYAVALRLGSVGETPENWYQPGITASQLCCWGGDNKELSPSEHSLVFLPSNCTKYGSHFFISLNPVGLQYFILVRPLTTPSTAPARLFPCGYQPPHPSVPFWLYIFGALIQVRLDITL